MPQHNWFEPGEYNFTCENCGRVYKSGEMRRGFWQNLEAVVCPKCYTPPHPQDYVIVLPDDQSVPIARNWYANSTDVLWINNAGDVILWENATGPVPWTP